MNFDPLSSIFSFNTHLREMHSCPSSSMSSYPDSCSHWESSFNFASSCFTLFIDINVSWTIVWSSFYSFSERLDKRFENSGSLLVVELLGVSFNISYCCTFDRSIYTSLPLFFWYYNNLRIFLLLFLLEIGFWHFPNRSCLRFCIWFCMRFCILYCCCVFDRVELVLWVQNYLVGLVGIIVIQVCIIICLNSGLDLWVSCWGLVCWSFLWWLWYIVRWFVVFMVNEL